MTIKYNLISSVDGENLTAFIDGEMYTADQTHPNFNRIVDAVRAGDENAASLFDPGKTAAERFERLSERVSVKNGSIYFDNEQVSNALTTKVVDFMNEGIEDFGPLVNFFEKIMTNENSHSRDQLFRWLEPRRFTITPDGNFLAYKGVRTVPSENGTEYQSISTGRAISDGIEYNGPIPNPVGAVVEMPRSEVQHDPTVGCHTGLHAGTYSYASGFSQGAVLMVEINPRDVVSVPTDCNSEKLRVCRYVVKEVVTNEYSGAMRDFSEDLDDEDLDEYDDCGY
jgi:hypothetical protein